MITIYGSPKTSAGRCFWCLEEVGAEYENKTINFREQEHKSEEFLKVNPNGKIPALIDDGFTIWDSMAINFYLADAYKPSLLGKDPKERGIVHQWSLWAIADLQGPLIDIFIQLIFVPEERRSDEVIGKARKKLPALFETLNNDLEKNQFLSGDKFSLADLNVSSVVTITEAIDYSIDEYPNIISWLSRLSERSAYRKYQDLIKD
jgi:glutathione S-transferase